MRIIVTVMSILMTLLLVSCQDNKEVAEVQEAHEVESLQPVQTQQQPAKKAPEIHNAVVEEVIQGSSYTYLQVKEGDAVHWIAISRSEMEVGETVSYKNPLEMRNFSSKELERTFEVIYFVGSIRKEYSTSTEQSPESLHQKPTVETKDVSIKPIEGGISIAELFSNGNLYANQVVRIKGQVTKVNLSIMGKNWVHLQDGTGELGSNDLLVTTQEEVNVGDVVIFEGTITLNKDFGSGYSYEILMEEGKLQSQ